MQNMIWQKIEGLQKEIVALKNLSKKSGGKKAKEQSHDSLYGLLKDTGVKFSWKDFQEAKRAIFSHSESHIQ